MALMSDEERRAMIASWQNEEQNKQWG
jgi:hypothetical protein